MNYDLDNNEKANEIKATLLQYNVPYSSLGNGTNRMGILIDGYAIKIALDEDGAIDNKREMLYSKTLYPNVIKVYECCYSGYIASFEYVELFTMDDFYNNRVKMREILKDITGRGFLVGDVGVTSKNYANWGTRPDGSICILDFAYCYDVKYGIFSCSEDGALLNYDKDSVKLICPRCGRDYEFMDIRRRITKKDQEKEIGDIRRLSYVIHKDGEFVTEVPEFMPLSKRKKQKKKLIAKAIKKKVTQDWDNPDQS